MTPDVPTSTVTIAGRRFPTVCAICPPYEDDPDPEWERMLGGPATGTQGGFQALIPCENGVLVAIEHHVRDGRQQGYYITLDSRTCAPFTGERPPLWLPHLVALHGGRLVAEDAAGPGRHPWYWTGADADWTVEHIDRISALPFDQPPGPAMRLVSLAEGIRLMEDAAA